MFEGIATYYSMTEHWGKTYNSNRKRLVCSISKEKYKEEFWADKKNKYFVRIFDFGKNELHQINLKHKTIQKVELSKLPLLTIKELKSEDSFLSYELTYEVDFGYKSSSKYSYKTDTGYFVNPNHAHLIRICSKIPNGNNEIASFIQERPVFRFNKPKEFRLVAIQPKKLSESDFELDKYKDFQFTTRNLNRVIHDKDWSTHRLKQEYFSMLINFYQKELGIELTFEQKENIIAYNFIHFGLMNEYEYKTTEQRLRIFEKEEYFKKYF